MKANDMAVGEPESLKQAIERISFTPVLVAQLCLCTLVMMIDGYDLSAMPLALPHILKIWNIEASSFSVALSAVLVGLGGGALLIAPFGDRFGRRPLVTGSTLAIALATFGTAYADSTLEFTVWRLLTGLALGACLANVTALVSEISPRHRRAGVLVLVSCGVSLGAVGAGLVVPTLVSLGGWQTIFTASAAITVLIAGVLYLALPESPTYLFLTKRYDALDTLLAKFDVTANSAVFEADAPGADVKQAGSIIAPLMRPYLFATFVFAGLYTVNALSVYMLVSWLPTLLPTVGFTVDVAARLVSLVQFGGLVGGLILSWLLDRSYTVPALGGGYIIVVLALVAVPYLPPSLAAWSVALLMVGAGVSGAHLAIMAVGAGFYPPNVLSAAIGVAVAVARLGAIAGPMVGGSLIAAGSGLQGFMLALMVPVLVCFLLVLLIPAARRSALGDAP